MISWRGNLFLKWIITILRVHSHLIWSLWSLVLQTPPPPQKPTLITTPPPLYMALCIYKALSLALHVSSPKWLIFPSHFLWICHIMVRDGWLNDANTSVIWHGHLVHNFKTGFYYFPTCIFPPKQVQPPKQIPFKNIYIYIHIDLSIYLDR